MNKGGQGFSDRWFSVFDRTVPNLILRLVMMLVGLTCVAFSVALSRATGLGVSTISAIPGVLSFCTPITIGVFTFAINMLFVVVQIALLRRNYHPLSLLCIPFVFLFSSIINFFVPICQLIPMPHYAIRIAINLLCCFITAFGVWVQVKAALIMLPGDGVVQVISSVFKLNFGKCKVAFDMSNTVIAAVVSLITMGGLYGVREGTLLLALLVGPIIKKINGLCPNIEKFMPTRGHITLTAQPKQEVEEPEISYEETSLPLVITIGREFGSGGRELAQAIDAELNVPVYDRSLIDMTAKEMGLSRDYVKGHEEEVRGGILFNLYAQQYAYVDQVPANDDAVFLAQARTITNLATHGSCVIVGRSANAILSERPNVFSVFVKAPIEKRIERVCRRDGMTESEALAKINAVDAERRNYSRLYLNLDWGVSGYDFIVDSSRIPLHELAQCIIIAAKASLT